MCAEFVKSPPTFPQPPAAEPQLVPGSALDPGDGVSNISSQTPLFASLGAWCYWEHFQVFPETPGRFILLKCCSDRGCHESSVGVKSPFPLSLPLSMDWGFCQVWQLLLGVLNSPAGNKS